MNSRFRKNKKVTVIKQDLNGNETWRYSGRILSLSKDSIVLEAYFDRENMEFSGIFLAKGDRFIETYYFHRWYNILEIHAKDDDRLRGWYCNISSPATVDDNKIYYKDLALDLYIFPDGRQVLLDEEEFFQLELEPEAKKEALASLAFLQSEFSNRFSPRQINPDG